ncbi:Crp/Fnr family transcriptional regulator [Streptomyces sp. NPDC051018]|uniref:Crp/Fnr family transcriptional regulator n=1 Tax=Streptomyces sp. NPDC051018 TaxID=3365639 RepID=UPI0037BB48D1
MNADAPTSDGTASPGDDAMPRQLGDAHWPVDSFVGLLSENSRRELFREGTVRMYSPGESLILQGEDSSHVMVIRHGVVKVVSHTAEGHTALLAIRASGDIVGELGALDSRPRSATVIAVGRVVVSVITGQGFRLLCEREPQLPLTLMRIVTNRLRASDQARIELGGYTPRVRLAKMLTSLAKSHGTAGESGVRIGIPLSHSDLASLIGSSQASLERSLRALRVEGVIDTGYRNLVIRDLPGLTRIADD